MNKSLLTLLVCSFLFLSCDNKKTTTIEEVDGKYILLEGDNIALYVPKDMEEISVNDYEKEIDQILDKEVRRRERIRHNFLKYSKGNFYFLRNEKGDISLDIKIQPYTDINPENSRLLLTMLNNNQKKYANLIGMDVFKQNAKFIKKGKDRIFKVDYVFNAMDKASGLQLYLYNSIYVVNHDYKTIMITINSLESVDFTSYMVKIK